MNPEAFTPKTVENFLHFWAIWKRRSPFPQPRDVSHARIFAEGVCEGRTCPVQPFWGKLVPISMMEITNVIPCLSHSINTDLTVLSHLDTSN